MKQGYKLKRQGWNGANQYVTHEIKITVEDRDNNIYNLSHQDCIGVLIFHSNRGTQRFIIRRLDGDLMFVSRFFWPTVKLLPMDLDGSLTDYEFLLKVCTKLNELIKSVNTLGSQVKLNTEAIEALQEDVANIMAELEKIKNGDYFSVYLDTLVNYIDNNLEGIVGRIMKFIIFGLSQDGHFVAMTPSTWQFIHWDTVMDYNSPLYGHLILQW